MTVNQALYRPVPLHDWVVRICVCCTHWMQWPSQEGGYVVPPAPGFIQLGVSIEPLAELAAKEGSRLGEVTEWHSSICRTHSELCSRVLHPHRRSQHGDACLVFSTSMRHFN